MRALKIVLGTLSALMGLIWLVGIFLPGEYRVERTTVIDAPASLVFAQVNSFPNWEAWSPWIAHDPTIDNTYSGPESGVGHVGHWTSDSSGEGTQKITVSKPDTHITTELEFGDRGTAEAYWDFEALGDDSTRVTWSMAGENQGAIGHYFALFMDDMVGPYYEEGLANLKAHAEALAAQAPPAPEDAAEAPAAAAQMDTTTPTPEAAGAAQ